MSKKTDPVERPLWKRLLLRRLKLIAGILIAVVVLLGGTYLIAPQLLMHAHDWRLAKSAGLSTHSVQVGDTRWVYYSGGQGPTMVLLHGFGASRKAWLKVAKPLTRNFHLIIPDLPGWGDSSRSASATYAIPAQAKRLVAFLKVVQVGRPMLVGEGMGGAIAGYVAASNPTRVGTLVLMDSLGLGVQSNALVQAAQAGHNPFLVDDRAGYRSLRKLLFDQPPYLPGRFIDVHVDRAQASAAFLKRVFAAITTPTAATVLVPRLGRLTMPVLGMWCRDDRVVGRAALNVLRKGLTTAPGISITLINGCGHKPAVEKPVATARILAGFAIAN